MKTDLQQVAMMSRVPLPLVPLFIPLERNATWSGKWALNCQTDAIIALGGPWNTAQQAVDAVLQTGNYKLRPNTKTPHLDRI
jgi:hypothetical protein